MSIALDSLARSTEAEMLPCSSNPSRATTPNWENHYIRPFETLSGYQEGLRVRSRLARATHNLVRTLAWHEATASLAGLLQVERRIC